MLPQMGPPETTIWEYPGEDSSWHDEFGHFVECIAREVRRPAAWPTPWPHCGWSATFTAAVKQTSFGERDDYHPKSPAHLPGRRRHRPAVLLPRAQRLSDCRGHRQVRLHHPAPDLRAGTDHQVLAAWSGSTACDEIQHPIIREALRLVGMDGAVPGDHQHGGHSRRHRPGLLRQLHHGPAQGPAHL